MCGAPHSGFSARICRVNALQLRGDLRSASKRADFQRQCRPKPVRCQRTRVSGRMIELADVAGSRRDDEPLLNQSFLRRSGSSCQSEARNQSRSFRSGGLYAKETYHGHH
jgi:hypothetical protein